MDKKSVKVQVKRVQHSSPLHRHLRKLAELHRETVADVKRVTQAKNK